MAVISWRYSYLFIQAPNTACTATAAALTVNCDGEKCPPRSILNPDGSVGVTEKHCTISDLTGHDVLSQAQLADLFKFTTVRNPFDILVSRWNRAGAVLQEAERNREHWLHRQPGGIEGRKKMASLSFPDWVVKTYGKSRRGLWRSRRTDHDMNGRFIAGTDAIMRFENLEADFKDVLKNLGVHRDVNLPKLNVDQTRRRDYRTYYTPEARKVLETAFRDELKTLGYEF